MLTTLGITYFHRNLEMHSSHIADELLDDNACNMIPHLVDFEQLVVKLQKTRYENLYW